MRELTTKQELFVQGLVKGLSQREAYKKAYNASKMKPESMDRVASRTLALPHVKARYEALMQEITGDTKEEVKNKIIDVLIAIVDGTYADLFDLVEDEYGTGLVTKPKADLSKFDMRAVKSYKYDQRGRVVVELYDKIQAINSLKELYGFASDEQKEDIKLILEGADEYGA